MKSNESKRSRTKKAVVEEPVTETEAPAVIEDTAAEVQLKKEAAQPKKEAPAATKKAARAAVGSSSTLLIANHHTGGIVFPRKGGGGVLMPPLRLAPGVVSRMDRQEWERRKKNPLVQIYLDKGLLAEVRRENASVSQDPTTSNLEVPEHLVDDEHSNRDAKSAVRKAQSGAVTIG